MPNVGQTLTSTTQVRGLPTYPVKRWQSHLEAEHLSVLGGTADHDAILVPAGCLVHRFLRIIRVDLTDTFFQTLDLHLPD
jgi:hypothetical protein